MLNNLELSYDKKKIKIQKKIFLVLCFIETVLFLITFCLAATYVNEEISGSYFAIFFLLFIFLLPYWLSVGIYNRAIKRWQFHFDGTYITYCPYFGKMQELLIKDISVVEITRFKRIVLRNQYGEVVINEKLGMIGGFDVLRTMQAYNVPIEFQPGMDELRKYILHRMDGMDEYARTGKQLYPCQPEAKEYVEEPESEERGRIEKKQKIGITIKKGFNYAVGIFFLVIYKFFGAEYFLLFLGIGFFISSVLVWFQEHQALKLEERVRTEGKILIGTVKNYQDNVSKNSKYLPIFEFQTNQEYHLCKGMRMDSKLHQKNLGQVKDLQYNIYYAPNLSTCVSYAGEEEFRTYKKKRNFSLTLWMVISAVIIIAGSMIAYYCYQDNSYSDAGKTIEITYDKEYSESNFTQDDISGKTVKWICATCGIYNYVNYLSSQKIGGTTPGSSTAESLKEMIDSGWGITSRTTAIDTINTLLESGHRKGFHKIIKEMKKEGLTDMTLEDAKASINSKDWTDEKKQRYIASLTAYADYGDCGLDAWDYCRAIQILGDCYLAGYISLEECLDQALPIAQLLQSEFDSWDDMNQSYLYGYWYYSKTDPEEYGSNSYLRYMAYEELQTMSYNPYKSLDFKMELKDTWSMLAD